MQNLTLTISDLVAGTCVQFFVYQPTVYQRLIGNDLQCTTIYSRVYLDHESFTKLKIKP